MHSAPIDPPLYMQPLSCLSQFRGLRHWFCCTLLILLPCISFAGAQQEEALSSAFQLVLHQALLNAPPPNPEHLSEQALRDQYRVWARGIDSKLNEYFRGHHRSFEELAAGELRNLFLQTVWYESMRARLDPALVLGVIEVESGFNKFAISSAGAVGYMQVMPFWMSQALELNDDHKSTNLDKQIRPDKVVSSTRLMHLQTNIRFGCAILRHYMDLEGNALERSLGRYNGNTADRAYALAVLGARRRWTLTGESFGPVQPKN